VVKLHFKSTEEFEGLFTKKTLAVTRSIVRGIELAMQKNGTRTAPLFEITFEGADSMYEISLPRSQWVQALESCLEHLHAKDLSNEQIDCWKLLEVAKAW
jgi:hypothetical protein